MGAVSIAEVLRTHAARDGATTAVVDGDRRTTRAQLLAAATRLAAAWAHEGTGRDDVVVIAATTGTGVLVASAAAWLLGAVPLPVPPGLPGRPGPERDAVLAAARPGRVVTDDDLARADDGAPPGAAGSLPRGAAAAGSSWKAGRTGGSTGAPKVVLSARPGLVDPDAHAVPFAAHRGALLVPAPLHTSAAFTYAARSLMAGQPVVLVPGAPAWPDEGPAAGPDPAAVLAAVRAHDVGWAVLSPRVMADVWRLGPAARAAAGWAPSGLERVVHLGAPCPVWLKRAWIAWLGPERVLEVFASTESHVVLSCDGREWLAHPGAVGRPAPGTVRVVDGAGRDVAPGTIGSVWLRPAAGPGTTYRYAGGARALAREDGWESLGDRGHLDEDGYLHLAGRASDVVRTATGEVDGAAVVAVLEQHPGVRAAVVRAGTAGDGLRALVEVDGVHAAELQHWAAEHLPASVVPRVRTTTAVLRDAAGKVRWDVVARHGQRG